MKLVLFIVALYNLLGFGQNQVYPDEGLALLLERLNLKGNSRDYSFSARHSQKRTINLLKQYNLIVDVNNEKELEYYLSLFNYYEINDSTLNSVFLKKDEYGLFRFYNYYSRDFNFALSPIIKYKKTFTSGENYTHLSNGLSIEGNYNDFEFGLKFYDNTISGKYAIERNQLSDDQLYVTTKINKNSIEFDNVDAYINYSWNNGVITLGKLNEYWGSGTGGKLIFSDRSQSFPMIKLIFEPTDWLIFSYFHGWLHSGIIDSSSYRITHVSNRPAYSSVQKQVAVHYIGIKPVDGVEVTLGESIIYSGSTKPMYLIPVLFFRVADHYYQKTNSDLGDNAQIFGEVSYTNTDIHTRFYTTIFIDELSVSSILKGENGPSAVAYTLGIKTLNPLLDGSLITAEYTRVNPFVYTNGDDAETYTNRDAVLGHWIGNNADQLFFRYDQKILLNLSLSLTAEFIRKGITYSPEQQYELPYPAFLSGGVDYFNNLSLNIRYEPINSLFVEAEYIHRLKSTGKFRNQYYYTEKSLFSLGIGYGL